MAIKTLENALFPADGSSVDVTKIEIEILPGGSCRWILWAGERRIYSAVARPLDRPAMLKATGHVLDGACAPAERN
jgi:hypothetical protein